MKKITMMLVGAFAAFAMSGGLVLGANYDWAGGSTTDRNYDWADDSSTDDNWEWALPGVDDAGAVNSPTSLDG